MLRILHTADWHIGRALNGWSRAREHAAALAEIEEIIVDRQVNALIIAGDVFDSMAPSAEARGMFYGAMDRFHSRQPSLSSLVIAGNHDHAGQLEAPSALFRRLRTVVAGTLRQLDGQIDPEKHHIVLRDAAGEPRAVVLAVPFLGVGDIPRVPAEEANGSAIVEGVRRLYGGAIAEGARAAAGLPLIVTGHLTLAGSAETEISERRILVGGEHAVPHDIFPTAVTYAALGHLHRPQSVGRPSIRYAGSLFPLTAAERTYNHGVSLVTLDDGNLTVEHIPLRRSVPFIRLPTTGALECGEVKAALQALDLDPQLALDQQPFIHVAVKVNGISSGIRAEVDEAASAFPVRLAAAPELVRAETEHDPGAEQAPPPMQLKDLDPLDLFSQAFAAFHRTQPSESHLRAFAAAREEA